MCFSFPSSPASSSAVAAAVAAAAAADAAAFLHAYRMCEFLFICMQVERGALSGQTRLASCALESIYVLAMHAADLQLQGGLYNPSLDAGKGVEALFVATPQGDSVQQVYVHLAQVNTFTCSSSSNACILQAAAAHACCMQQKHAACMHAQTAVLPRHACGIEENATLVLLLLLLLLLVPLLLLLLLRCSWRLLCCRSCPTSK